MRIQLPSSPQNKIKLLVAAIFLSVLLLALISKVTSKPETEGDTASKDSSAFLIYKKQTYLPTNNKITDELIRADVAYFARKTLPVYDPNEHPTVTFTVDKISKDASGKTVIAGKYERSKNKIEIRFTTAINDRIDNSITDLKVNKTLSNELPSNSRINQLIKKLPVTQEDYIVSYIAGDGSVSVTLAEQNPQVLQVAKQFIADSLGVSVNDLEKYPVGYTFPTNFDDQNLIEPISHD